MTDRNEALRLADSIHEMNNAAYMTAIANLNERNRQQAERIAELEAERDQHKHTATSLIALLADIRMACGDNGKRMQPELVEFIGSLTAERDQLRAEVERLRADAERLDWLEQHDGRFHNLDRISSIVGVGFIPAAKPDFKAKTLRAAIDAARTTHKDEG